MNPNLDVHAQPHSWAEFSAAWELFRDPVLAAAVAGATLGYLGVYIVLRRMVFVSAALSQAAGLGVAFAFYTQIALGLNAALGEPILWAVAATLLTTLGIALAGRERWLSRESVLGCVYLAGSAGALLLGTQIAQEAHEISSILFGTAVLVTPTHLSILLGVAGLVMAIHLLGSRGFRFASFDPDGASVRGLPVRLLDAVLLASIAIVVSVATRVLGALPVFAFSVLPAMAAVMLAPNVKTALLWAGLLGAVSGALGYLVAFRYSWPVGASETAIAALMVAGAAMLRRVWRG